MPVCPQMVDRPNRVLSETLISLPEEAQFVARTGIGERGRPPVERTIAAKKDPLSPLGGYGGSGCFEQVGEHFSSGEDTSKFRPLGGSGDFYVEI